MTSLYAQNFTLLPRPARSVFSLGNEATRATLPDFETVEQLSDFVHRLSVWRMDRAGIHGTVIQLKIGASFIALLIVVIILTISRRMYDRSFWLVRIIKKSSGRVIVPNAMLSFASVQGLFAATYVAFIWLYCDWFGGGTPSSLPRSPILWLGMTWWPLLCGASSAAWGTYFATPENYQQTFGVRQRSQLQSFLSHAYTINTLGLAFPLAVGAAISGPAIVSNRGYVRALDKSQQWMALYGQQTQFTQAMVQDAQRVWFRAIDGMYMANVLFCIWTCAAVMICFAYSLVSIRLLTSIYAELVKREQAPVRVFGIVTTHIFSKGDDGDDDDDDEDDGAPAVTARQRAMAQRKADRMMHELREAAAVKELGGAAAADAEVEVTREIVPASASIDTSAAGMPTMTRAVRTQVAEPHHLSFNEGPKEETPTPPPSPPKANALRLLLPNFFMHKNAAVVGAGTTSRSAQMRELRKAFIHIVVQFLAISPACAVMAGVALMLATTMYGGMEQPSRAGGTQYERFLTIALLMADVCVCFFGAITLIAIAMKAYEPVFSNVNFLGGRSSGNMSSSSGNGGGTASHATSPVAKPPRRKSLGLGRVLGRSAAGRKERRKSINHAMSTFFETHTRTGHVQVPSSRNGSEASSQEALQYDTEVLKGREGGGDIEQGLGREVGGGKMYVKRTTTVSSVEEVKQHFATSLSPPPTPPTPSTWHDQRDREGGGAASRTLSPAMATRARSTTASSAGTFGAHHQHESGVGQISNEASGGDDYFRGGTGRARSSQRGGGAQVY